MKAGQVVEKAMKKADGALASFSESEWTNVSFENGRLKSVESSQRTHLEARVIKGGKEGSSYTTDASDEDGVAARALDAAAFGSEAHYTLPGAGDYPDVKVFDAAVPPVTKEEMVTIGEEMVSILREYDDEIQIHAGVVRGFGRSEIATSRGAEGARETTDFGVSLNGLRVRGTDMLWADEYSGWRKRDLDHVALARRVVERFRLAETIVPVASGNLPVVFTPEGMRILLLALVLGVNGKNVFLGSSPLKGRLGEGIADGQLTLTDNPLVDYAKGSGGYDGEAVPRRVTPLIEQGTLRSFLYDLDTAGRAGTESTGHGPGCSPTNLVMAPGDVSYDQMLADTKEGLLVHDVLGLGQGNAISGEFSVNVQLAYKIENGTIAGRVKDVMLAGNTYDAIRDIEAVGDAPEWVSAFGGTCHMPYVKVGGLSVVAK